MASFVPYHRKKKERLERLESSLKRLISRGASQEKLLKVALEVRGCRIRVLRANQNQNPERNAAERAAFLKLESQVDALRVATAESVLADFMPVV
jgi:hypothetical protein